MYQENPNLHISSSMQKDTSTWRFKNAWRLAIQCLSFRSRCVEHFECRGRFQCPARGKNTSLLGVPFEGRLDIQEVLPEERIDINSGVLNRRIPEPKNVMSSWWSLLLARVCIQLILCICLLKMPRGSS